MDDLKLQVFDPAMCCSTGVCGPEVDPELVRFGADLDWLRGQGVEVERHNLAAAPAAYARTACVRDALSSEGSGCLPLIVVGGSIVSRRVYPTRAELASLLGIAGLAEAESAVADALASGSEAGNDAAPSCGPGCDCTAAPRHKRIKTAVSVLALVLVVVALVHREVGADRTAAGGTAAVASTGFAVAQPALTDAPSTPEQFSVGLQVGAATEEERQARPDAAVAAPAQAAGAASEPGEPASEMDESLTSLSELNAVAMDQDAVFIFLPGPSGESPADKTSSAVLAARSSIEAKNVKVGLYTLGTGSLDYAAVSKQAQTPAILVAGKGGGMEVVSGNVTEDKLLQAYVATTAAACGPSGCGPSGCP